MRRPCAVRVRCLFDRDGCTNHVFGERGCDRGFHRRLSVSIHVSAADHRMTRQPTEQEHRDVSCIVSTADEADASLYDELAEHAALGAASTPTIQREPGHADGHRERRRPEGRRCARADGMNQLGDEGGTVFNRRAYEDYTNYEPVNTAYALSHPSRWQPLLITPGNGTFTAPQFITPQWAIAKPYSYNRHRFGQQPSSTRYLHFRDCQAQADEVSGFGGSSPTWTTSVARPELFDNKISSLGCLSFVDARRKPDRLDEFVHTLAHQYRGVRRRHRDVERESPLGTSALGDCLLNGSAPSVRGAARKGTWHAGREWRSIINTANHPEYPSGSACFCAAHARQPALPGLGQFRRSVPVAAGSSVIEPGVTPTENLVLGPGIRSPSSNRSAAKAGFSAVCTSGPRSSKDRRWPSDRRSGLRFVEPRSSRAWSADADLKLPKPQRTRAAVWPGPGRRCA